MFQGTQKTVKQKINTKTNQKELQIINEVQNQIPNNVQNQQQKKLKLNNIQQKNTKSKVLTKEPQTCSQKNIMLKKSSFDDNIINKISQPQQAFTDRRVLRLYTIKENKPLQSKDTEILQKVIDPNHKKRNSLEFTNLEFSKMSQSTIQLNEKQDNEILQIVNDPKKRNSLEFSKMSQSSIQLNEKLTMSSSMIDLKYQSVDKLNEISEIQDNLFQNEVGQQMKHNNSNLSLSAKKNYKGLSVQCANCQFQGKLLFMQDNIPNYYKCTKCLQGICIKDNCILEKCFCYCPNCFSKTITEGDKKHCVKCDYTFCTHCQTYNGKQQQFQQDQSQVQAQKQKEIDNLIRIDSMKQQINMQLTEIKRNKKEMASFANIIQDLEAEKEKQNDYIQVLENQIKDSAEIIQNLQQDIKNLKDQKIEIFPKQFINMSGKLIGKGSYGSVYLTQIDSKQYAQKIQEFMINEDNQHFQLLNTIRELTQIIKINQIKSERLIKTRGIAYDYDESKERYILAEYFDYYKNGTIENFRHNFNLQQKLEILYNVSLSIYDMHVNDMIHGDLKPTNFMVCDDLKSVIIIDYGTVKFSQKDETINENLAYSPLYAAPEILQNQSRSKASDVYSFGCIAFSFITKKLPWCWDSNKNKNTQSLIQFVLNNTHSFVQHYFQVMQGSIQDIGGEQIKILIEQCTDFDPKKRPNAEFISQFLQQIVQQDYQDYMQKETF